MKIKKDDNVQVMTGKDRGRQVKVGAVNEKEGLLMLAGINEYKRHRKSQTSNNSGGEIVTLSRPVKVANVALVCPKCKQVTRIGYKLTEKKRLRICRKCEVEI